MGTRTTTHPLTFVEIQFSGRRFHNGAQIPFHVQKYKIGGLIPGLELSSVTFDGGLAAATIAVD